MGELHVYLFVEILIERSLEMLCEHISLSLSMKWTPQDLN